MQQDVESDSCELDIFCMNVKLGWANEVYLNIGKTKLLQGMGSNGVF
jgi:hypothetical protein